MDQCLDGLDRIRNAGDSDQSLKVIGEGGQAHLGLHASRTLAQEMRCPVQALRRPLKTSTAFAAAPVKF
jgi:hypothetical protein